MTDTTLPPPTAFQSGPTHFADVRGDALETMFDFAGSRMKPTIVVVEDPLSGANAPIALLPNGQVAAVPSTLFGEYLDGPRYRQGTATLLSLDSFIDHVNRFSDGDSVVFADNTRSKPSLTAVLDYHEAGSTNSPRFGRHRSSFVFPLSDEWVEWNKKNATAMSMGEFAKFLEDHIVDVMLPEDVQLSPAAAKFVERLGGKGRIADPAQLMQLANNFEVYESSNAGQAVNLSSGAGAFSFETIHTDRNGQPLEVPQMFVLGIPVFKMGEPYQVLARLRYRKSGGEIVFYYELWRTDLIFDHAFNEAVEKVKAETTRPVLLGSPEAA